MNHLALLFLTRAAWEYLGAAALLIALLGTWYAWRLQWHRSDVEEAAKDGMITEESAKRRLLFVEWRVVVLVCSGIALLIVCALGVVL